MYKLWFTLIHKWYREDGTEGYLRWENSLAKSDKSSFINYIDFLNWYRRVNFPVQYNVATSLTVHYLLFLFRLTTVSVYGTKYRVGAVVCVGYDDDGLPDFASVLDIFVLGEGKIYFVVKRIKTIVFSGHFHSYEVRRPADEDIFVLQPEDLHVYLPMHTVKASVCQNSALYVTPRYLPPKSM